MDYALVALAALVVAALTLFSGFGLGTLLMPVFALFFPIPVAVAATAVVHLSNNVFKVFLVGRNADKTVVLKFALPAALAAVVGALLLQYVSGAAPLLQYELAGRTHEVTPIKLIIALLIVGFAILELSPQFEKLTFPPKFIPLGGVLSGFFGGLSGHQGALRSAFLIRAGLPKEAFIGTMVLSAVVVDVTRLLVYGSTFFTSAFATVNASDHNAWGLIITGTLAAFAGSFIGARLVKKVTLRTVQRIVGIMLLLLGLAMGGGLI